MIKSAGQRVGYTGLIGIFAAVLVMIYVPLAVMMIFSFNRPRFSTFPFREFSLRWYETLLADTTYINAFINSLIVATAASATAIVLAFACAYSLVNSSFWGKNFFLLCVLAPLAVPLILLGIALRVYLYYLGVDVSLFFVYVGHTVYVLPLATLNIRNRLAQIPASLEQAAWDLGASRLKAILLVVLPQCRGAIVATFLLTFTFAFDEFIVAYLLTKFQLTFPVKIWVSLLSGFDPTVNAAGTFVLLFSIAIGVTAQAALMRGDDKTSTGSRPVRS